MGSPRIRQHDIPSYKTAGIPLLFVPKFPLQTAFPKQPLSLPYGMLSPYLSAHVQRVRPTRMLL